MRKMAKMSAVNKTAYHTRFGQILIEQPHQSLGRLHSMCVRCIFFRDGTSGRHEAQQQHQKDVLTSSLFSVRAAMATTFVHNVRPPVWVGTGIKESLPLDTVQ